MCQKRSGLLRRIFCWCLGEWDMNRVDFWKCYMGCPLLQPGSFCNLCRSSRKWLLILFLLSGEESMWELHPISWSSGPSRTSRRHSSGRTSENDGLNRKLLFQRAPSGTVLNVISKAYGSKSDFVMCDLVYWSRLRAQTNNPHEEVDLNEIGGVEYLLTVGHWNRHTLFRF